MRTVKNINLVYVNEANAGHVAEMLREDGYDVKTSDCTGYVNSVVQRVGGADPDQKADVYHAITVALGITDGNY